MYIKNKTGPSTDPCGIPPKTVFQFETSLSTTTLCLMLLSHCSIQFIILITIRWDFNLSISLPSTVAVDGNTIEKVDRYVYLDKTVTQAGDLLPEIKTRIALGWAAFRKVANIMKSRKASVNVKRKVYNEYVLPVMVYGSDTWALKKAHTELDLLSVAQHKIEHIMLGITRPSSS